MPRSFNILWKGILAQGAAQPPSSVVFSSICRGCGREVNFWLRLAQYSDGLLEDLELDLESWIYTVLKVSLPWWGHKYFHIGNFLSLFLLFLFFKQIMLHNNPSAASGLVCNASYWKQIILLSDVYVHTVLAVAVTKPFDQCYFKLSCQSELEWLILLILYSIPRCQPRNHTSLWVSPKPLSVVRYNPTKEGLNRVILSFLWSR